MRLALTLSTAKLLTSTALVVPVTPVDPDVYISVSLIKERDGPTAPAGVDPDVCVSISLGTSTSAMHSPSRRTSTTPVYPDIYVGVSWMK
jgi:hypothetical protein